jgi:hypothetical protein
MVRPFVWVTDGQDGLKDSGPAHVKEVRDDGSCIFSATICRDEMLLRAVFEITKDGYVDVIEEKVIGHIPFKQ